MQENNKAFYIKEDILQRIFTFQCPLHKIGTDLIFFTVLKEIFFALIWPAAKQAKRDD